MPRLILASTSRYRHELLSRLGVPFTALAPLCDEESLKAPDATPGDLAMLLAHAKAASLCAEHGGAYVLGSDQVVDLDGEILGKPGSLDAAVAQLLRMRGRRHRLLTAFALVSPEGEVHSHLDVHTLHMRALGDEALRRYVEADQPSDCAGSYKIEGRGIALFERVEGGDFTAIMGLPLIALTGTLRSVGFDVP